MQLIVTVWLVMAVSMSSMTVSMTVMAVSMSFVTVSMTFMTVSMSSMSMFVMILSPMTVSVIQTAIKQRVAVTVTSFSM